MRLNVSQNTLADAVLLNATLYRTWQAMKSQPTSASPNGLSFIPSAMRILCASARICGCTGVLTMALLFQRSAISVAGIVVVYLDPISSQQLSVHPCSSSSAICSIRSVTSKEFLQGFRLTAVHVIHETRKTRVHCHNNDANDYWLMVALNLVALQSAARLSRDHLDHRIACTISPPGIYKTSLENRKQ